MFVFILPAGLLALNLILATYTTLVTIFVLVSPVIRMPYLRDLFLQVSDHMLYCGSEGTIDESLVVSRNGFWRFASQVLAFGLFTAVTFNICRALGNARREGPWNTDKQIESRILALSKRMERYSLTLCDDQKFVKSDGEAVWRLSSNNSKNEIDMPHDRVIRGPCAICFGDYDSGDGVTWSSNLACRHIFHTECIRAWLSTQRAYQDQLCPTCRVPFFSANNTKVK